MFSNLSFKILNIELGIGMLLFCSKSVPLHRSLIVLWNTVSVGVHITQTVLGNGIPLFSKGGPFTQAPDS